MILDYTKKPPFPKKGERHLAYTCVAKKKFLIFTTATEWRKREEVIR